MANVCRRAFMQTIKICIVIKEKTCHIAPFLHVKNKAKHGVTEKKASLKETVRNGGNDLSDICWVSMLEIWGSLAYYNMCFLPAVILL